MKQTSVDDLLGQSFLVISFNDQNENQKDVEEEKRVSYPNLEQSIFRDESGMHKAVKKSSFVLQDSQSDQFYKASRLSQSFSDLNGSTRDEGMFQSKLKLQNKEISRESREFRQSKQAKQNNFWDLNKSIFTDKQNTGLTFPQQQKEKDEPQQQPINQHNPFQMELVASSEGPIEKSQKKQPSQNEIKVILRSTNYFLEKQNGDSIMINGQMLRDLYDEFFKKEIFIPLFKYQKFDQWNRSNNKFDMDLEAHRIFKTSLQRYVKFINGHYPNQFSLVFKVLQEIQRGKVAKKREQLNIGFLNFDFTSLVQNFKNYMSSSKTQILRNSILAKIRSFRQNIKIAESYGLTKQVQMMAAKIQQEWNWFSQVQLLLNLQETEYYCTKKIENSPELKFRQIWIKYRDFIRNEKLRHSEQFLKNILI